MRGAVFVAFFLNRFLVLGAHLGYFVLPIQLILYIHNYV
jgi:hypothetical protein